MTKKNHFWTRGKGKEWWENVVPSTGSGFRLSSTVQVCPIWPDKPPRGQCQKVVKKWFSARKTRLVWTDYTKSIHGHFTELSRGQRYYSYSQKPLFATCQYQGHLNSRSSDLKWDYTAFWWGIDRSNQRTHTCNRSRDTDKWFLAQKWLYLKNHFACTGGRKFEVHRVRC